MADPIDRQAALEILYDFAGCIVDTPGGVYQMAYKEYRHRMEILPSAQPEPLTDKEQRIFLAAMAREEKVCKEVDEEMTREPYEDSLVRVCREIERKVKGALWTN